MAEPEFSKETLEAVETAFNKSPSFAKICLLKLHLMGYHVFHNDEIATLLRAALDERGDDVN